MYKIIVPLLYILYSVTLSSAGFNFNSNSVNHVNRELSKYMLPRLNAARAHVKPTPVVPLANLTWDANLATGAGKWASKCVIDDFSDDYYAMKVGESITTVPLANVLDLNHGLLSWLNQNVTYSLADDACLKGFDCHAYKQVVWNKTTSVGCATNLCNGQAVLVCQFFPPGNYPGVRPFHSEDATTVVTRLDVANTTDGSRKRVVSAVSHGSNGNDSRKRKRDNGDNSCTVSNTDQGDVTGKCQAMDACKGQYYYWGGGLCQGYSSDDTVCCIYETGDTFTPNEGRLQFPESQNWLDVPAVTSIKNQQQCGSCWDFSTTAAAESAYLIYSGGQTYLDISEQMVLNCVGGGNSCNGGNTLQAAQYYVKNKGAPEDAELYTAEDGQCSQNSTVGIYTFTTAGSVYPWSNKEDVLAALAKYGPLVVTVEVNDDWQNYSGGILNRQLESQPNHAVLLVGYDSKSDAYVIKNSWGEGWGENGYVRVAVEGDSGLFYWAPTYIVKTE